MCYNLVWKFRFNCVVGVILSCKHFMRAVPFLNIPMFPLTPKSVATYKWFVTYRKISRVQIFLHFFPEFASTLVELGVFSRTTELKITIEAAAVQNQKLIFRKGKNNLRKFQPKIQTKKSSHNTIPHPGCFFLSFILRAMYDS